MILLLDGAGIGFQACLVNGVILAIHRGSAGKHSERLDADEEDVRGRLARRDMWRPRAGARLGSCGAEDRPAHGSAAKGTEKIAKGGSVRSISHSQWLS